MNNLSDMVMKLCYKVLALEQEVKELKEKYEGHVHKYLGKPEEVRSDGTTITGEPE